jgi:E3 ubiquitin-protein ligase HUWE1
MHIVNGKSCEAAMSAARAGLCDMIPSELLASLSPVDLERVVCGLPKISVAAWKSATIYEPKVSSAEEQRRVDWFWEAIESFTPSDQTLVLHFWAAYTHLPHSGFEGLNFKVRFDEKLTTDHLPMAQTCFLTLRVPKYTSAAQCAERLLHAVRTGYTGFGFA